MGGGRSSPGAPAKAAPSRVGALTGPAAGAGRLSPLPAAGGCPPLRGLRHRAKQISAGNPSNGADDYFAESRSQ
jgi:hypothetical protein